MPRGFRRGFLTMGLLLLLTGWWAIKFVEQQQAAVERLGTYESMRTWARGGEVWTSSSGKSTMTAPGRTTFIIGGLLMGAGVLMICPAALSYLEDRKQPVPEGGGDGE